MRQRLVNQRLIPTPMETRGAAADYDPGTGSYTVWMSSQAPHVMRLLMTAFVFGIPETKMRCVSPNVGGAFGSKIFLYPEYVLMAAIAEKVGRPVKWIESRRENYTATTHGRDHVTYLEVGAKRDGTITALKVEDVREPRRRPLHDRARHPDDALRPHARGLLPDPGDPLPGDRRLHEHGDGRRLPRRRPARGDLHGRAGGGPRRARARAWIRSRCGARTSSRPRTSRYDPGILAGLSYDSGEYEKALDRALEIVDYDGFRAEQAEARAQGRHLGIGFSTYVEICGVAPSAWIGTSGQGWGAGLWESANVRVHLTGKVVVTTGCKPGGQGHETTMAQVVADELGVPLEDVTVEHGDTQGTPFGYGTYGSRSAAVGTVAVYNALQRIKAKATRIAAHMLEADPEDVTFENGRAFVVGSPDTGKTIQEIAAAAAVGYEPAGRATSRSSTTPRTTTRRTARSRSARTWPWSRSTPRPGEVALKRYVAVDDVGRVINPLIVDGQVHGGIAQGVAQALWEGAVYDENGQLLSSSLMDYAVPKAEFFPAFELDRTETLTDVNPLGVKGAGETGTIASTPAVVNAVVDALAPLGIAHIDMPLTPERVWRAIEQAKA